MKIKSAAITVALLSLLVGCGSNSGTPSVEAVTLGNDGRTVSAGQSASVAVSFRVTAVEQSDRFETEPFFATVLYPVGATFVDGSSEILFGTGRSPDAMGSCPDGRGYLVYNFQPGEFPDPYHFKEFTVAIQVQLKVGVAANEQEVSAIAAVSGISNPCVAEDLESTKLSVR